MERHNRSPSSDSHHPGDRIAKPYSIVFTAVVLFIAMFGTAIFLDYQQFESTMHNTLSADKTTTDLHEDLLLANNNATIEILQTYARRPLFIDAVKSKDLAGAQRHLSDLKKGDTIKQAPSDRERDRPGRRCPFQRQISLREKIVLYRFLPIIETAFEGKNKEDSA